METPKVLKSVLAVLILLFVNLAWGAASEQVLYSFSGADGVPAGLVSDGAGNLYGTTYAGGAYSQGSVFELSPSTSGWTRSVLYSFTGGRDGRSPSESESLVFDTAGNLYGTTVRGGSGSGTVFKLAPNGGGGWTESVIHYFKNAPAHYPESGLVFDAAGNLYGTAFGSPGAVFELSPTSSGPWKIRILHKFGKTRRDGIGPLAALAFDPAGNLYGTTYVGGVPKCGLGEMGCGTVFKLTPASGGAWRYSRIYSFAGGANGDRPYAGVVSDAAGNLYGTTALGGNTGCDSNSDGCGIVFELSPNLDGTWTETLVYSFAGSAIDGGEPFSGLIFDHAGNLFGTTYIGGSSGFGTVFELTPQSGGWQETVLHNFADSDGQLPLVGVISNAAGNLYGTTITGGATGGGAAFEVTP
ncbi:MAG TPA: choice-of-anchor tandem repeat GloVer-containing protein [Terriglobales bacterium]|nr:choice-of-anchor tandem repeat GloVer-containing protein [Terriglobales bacterium]